MRLAAIQLMSAQHDPIKETFDLKKGKSLVHYNSLPVPFLNLYQLKLSTILFVLFTLLY